MFKRKNKNSNKANDDYGLDSNHSYDNYRDGTVVSHRRFPISWLVIATTVFALIGLVYYFMVVPTMNKAEKIADTLAKGMNIIFGFTPTITINEKVYFTENKPILELAVMQKGLDVNYEYEKTVFFITSKLELEGKYLVKAGFDLKDDAFSIVIDDKEPIVITLYLPKPKILSTELVNYAVQKDEGLLWSQITPQEREDAVNNMNGKARKTAEQDSILDETKWAVESQIREILQESNAIIKFEYVR